MPVCLIVCYKKRYFLFTQTGNCVCIVCLKSQNAQDSTLQNAPSHLLHAGTVGDQYDRNSEAQIAYDCQIRTTQSSCLVLVTFALVILCINHCQLFN